MKRAGGAAPRKPTIDWEKRIVEALGKAGSKGLTRSRLAPAAKPEAGGTLEALLRQGAVVRLGSASKARYFLARCAPTARQAVEAIDRRAAQSPARLFLEKELGKFCSKAEAFFLREAVQELVQKGILLRLTRGKTLYYTHREALGSRDRTEIRDFDPARVCDAYRALMEEGRILNVRILALASRAQAPLDSLKAWLLEESRAGRAHLSRGDWSLASEEEREAAISLDGQPHLLVRLEQRA
ncbi:hypothetical protein MAMC_00991 [Methylacidimicrobium cyclopophantes]|uniref:Uncharacterized protein n=1 Tax=Methylacidimicrobium cyclopophantes TaxID=1041766 RepID=A0A5E6MJG3_9BACT|nr:hypothetical protein [Methylacidimicrobium cyclopophantes]VVM06207.1 hypothetical protein MAMC_00991 [Methylacidimicrobium cyclopophantes]